MQAVLCKNWGPWAVVHSSASVRAALGYRPGLSYAGRGQARRIPGPWAYGMLWGPASHYQNHQQMANLETATTGQRKTRALRVDLTPMVDLGFLLITFFIFTTTLSQPSVVQLAMPTDGPPTNVPESGAITLIPHRNGVACFVGQPPASGQTMAQYSYGGGNSIRQALMAIQQNLAERPAPQPLVMVLIKPAANASFKQVVQVLDEMTICGFTRYALLPLEPALAVGF